MALAAISNPRATRTGRFRQLRPTMISRPTTSPKITRKARSAIAVKVPPAIVEKATQMRPRSHNKTSTARGQPCKGKRPVQLGIAVSKNPAMAATTTPNTISWKCQATESNSDGSASVPARSGIQSPMATQAHTPAQRKNGRNIWYHEWI